MRLWTSTVSIQMERIQAATDGSTPVVDSYLLVMAMRQVLRGAEMAEEAMAVGQARDRRSDALRDFRDAVPGGKDARNVIDDGQAARFWYGFRWAAQGRPVLDIGPFSIDLVVAEDAVFRLRCGVEEAVHAADGFVMPKGTVYAGQRGRRRLPVMAAKR